MKEATERQGARASPDTDTDSSDRSDLRTAANVLGVLVLVALVLPFVVYAVPGLVGADASYVVLSGSMEPAMSPGDVILVEEAPPSTISTGDVVTFAAEGETRPTTHRVIEVAETEQGRAFRTAGDANEDPDPALVSADQVRGVVPTVGGHLFVIPLIGYVIQFAGTPAGILTLLVAPLALLVLSEAYVLVRSSRDGDGASEDPADPEPAASTEPDPEMTTATAATTAEGGAESAEAETDEDGRFTLTPMDLRLTVGVLVLFTLYAAWVAYATLEVWAVTGATTVGATLVLVGAMYLFGGSPPGERTRSGADAPATVATAATGPPGRSREAIYDGGTDATAETPRESGYAAVFGEPTAGTASREQPPDSNGAEVVPRSPAGPAEPAIVEMSSEAGPKPESSRGAPTPAASPSGELEPAIVEVPSGAEPKPESSRGAPTPAAPAGGELEPAVVPVEDDHPAAAAAVAAGSDGGSEETGREGPHPPSENPLVAAPYVLLYYIGYTVVESTRFLQRRLAAVGGGGAHD